MPTRRPNVEDECSISATPSLKISEQHASTLAAMSSLTATMNVYWTTKGDKGDVCRT